MSKKNCPYCYTSYKIADLNIHCEECNEKFDISKLKISDKAYLKIGILPKLNYCVNCKNTKRSNIIFKCSACHQSLSRDIIELKNKIISIVGGRGSGKTIYILSLIDFIEKNIKFGDEQIFISNRNQEDEVEDNENDLVTKLQDRLRVDKEVVKGTKPKALKSEESTAGLPLIYFYTNKEDTIALSFYDSAGEDLQNYKILQKEYDYIINSSGIIFIMDIFSGVENFRNTKKTLINLIDLIRIEYAINRNTKISIPIAFVFNKFDIYNGGKIEDRHILWNGNNNEEVLKEIEKIHNSLSEHFKTTSIEDLGNLLSICTKNFKNYKFIPVSSLGYNPVDNKLLDNVKSFDIEYPYLFLLENI